MPIQPMTFPALSMQQTNPGMTGINAWQDIIMKQLQTEAAQTQNKYLDPALKAALSKSQQEAELYTPLTQSEIDERKAQTGLLGQETQWYGPKAQAKIALQNAQTSRSSQLLPFDVQKARFEQQNPLFGQPGVAGQIGDMLYLQQLERQRMQQGQAPQQAQQQMPQQQGQGFTPANQANIASILQRGMIPPSNAPQQQMQQQMPQFQSPQQQQNPLAITPQSLFGNQPQAAQQPQSLSDLLNQSIYGTMASTQAKTNYMNAMPGIRAATNPVLLAAAATNEDIARGLAETGVKQINPNAKVTDADVKAVQDYAKDAILKKTKTAAQLNQMQYAGNLDMLLDQGSQLMPSVSQYAGVPGKLKLASDAAQASLGTLSPEYSDYLKFTRVTVPYAAGEMGRTLGKQATDKMTEILTKTADPNYWDSNPDLAMKQWNWMVDTFKGVKGKGGINQALASSNANIRQQLAGINQQIQPSISQGNDFSNMSDEELMAIAGGG